MDAPFARSRYAVFIYWFSFGHLLLFGSRRSPGGTSSCVIPFPRLKTVGGSLSRLGHCALSSVWVGRRWGLGLLVGVGSVEGRPLGRPSGWVFGVLVGGLVDGLVGAVVGAVGGGVEALGVPSAFDHGSLVVGVVGEGLVVAEFSVAVGGECGGGYAE